MYHLILLMLLNISCNCTYFVSSFTAFSCNKLLPCTHAGRNMYDVNCIHSHFMHIRANCQVTKYRVMENSKQIKRIQSRP